MHHFMKACSRCRGKKATLTATLLQQKITSLLPVTLLTGLHNLCTWCSNSQFTFNCNFCLPHYQPISVVLKSQDKFYHILCITCTNTFWKDSAKPIRIAGPRTIQITYLPFYDTIILTHIHSIYSFCNYLINHCRWKISNK
jgi:hypothetical protein